MFNKGITTLKKRMCDDDVLYVEQHVTYALEMVYWKHTYGHLFFIIKSFSNF